MGLGGGGGGGVVASSKILKGSYRAEDRYGYYLAIGMSNIKETIEHDTYLINY